ncbi:MAG: hypothetical protein SW019_21200, partial [Actinomycetota bacterium]|nr:hypothetical protein [Actinomycetota bacterium]
MDDTAATRDELYNTARALGLEVSSKARKTEILHTLAGQNPADQSTETSGTGDATDAGGREWYLTSRTQNILAFFGGDINTFLYCCFHFP